MTSPRTAAAAPSARAWRNAVFATFIVNGLASAAWVSRMPSVRDALGVSVGEVGVLIVGVSAGSIIGLLISGQVVHAIGGRNTIAIALPLSGVALAVIGLGATLGEFAVAIAGFALYGLASASTDVAMNVEGSGVEHAVGRQIMPWFHASWSLGTVAGAGIGSAMAFAGVPPLVHLGLAGALTIVATAAVVRWLPRGSAAASEREAGAEAGAPLGFRARMAIWVEPRTLLIGLIMLGMAFTEGSANDWLAIGLIDGRGLDNGQGALMFGVFTAAMTIGRIAGVPIIDRFGRVAVLRGAALSAAVGLALVILVPIIPIAVVGIVLWGLGASLGFPVGMSAAGDDPAKAAARVSAVATIAYLAFLAGPPLIGFVGEHIGVLNALWIVLGLIVISTLAIPAAREQRPRATVPAGSAASPAP